MRSSVDLPEPDWPITPRSWPAGTTSDTWSTARLPPKLLTTPSNRSIEPLDGSPAWAVPVGCCGKATLWLQNQDALWGIAGCLKSDQRLVIAATMSSTRASRIRSPFNDVALFGCPGDPAFSHS